MIVGISMVRDEADVISFTLAHLAAEGIDHFIVADNGSSDATRFARRTGIRSSALSS